jgi:transposase InsO family protein
VARDLDLTASALGGWVKQARQRRRYKCTTMSDHNQPVAPNLLARQFHAVAPNQRWVGDTTDLLVGDSGAKMFLAVILGLFAGRCRR